MVSAVFKKHLTHTIWRLHMMMRVSRSLLIWGEDSEEDGGWWWGDHLYPGSLSLTHFTVPTRAFSFFINKNLLTIKTLDADVYLQLLHLLQLLLETILHFIIFKNKEQSEVK